MRERGRPVVRETRRDDARPRARSLSLPLLHIHSYTPTHTLTPARTCILSLSLSLPTPPPLPDISFLSVAFLNESRKLVHSGCTTTLVVIVIIIVVIVVIAVIVVIVVHRASRHRNDRWDRLYLQRAYKPFIRHVRNGVYAYVYV